MLGRRMRWKLFLYCVTYSHTAALCSDAHTAAQKHKHLSEHIYSYTLMHTHIWCHMNTRRNQMNSSEQ